MPKKKGNYSTLEDQNAVDFAKSAAKKFSKGTFTASQTGARAYADQRRQRTNAQMIRADMAAGTEAFEKGSVNKDPMTNRERPKRSKRK